MSFRKQDDSSGSGSGSSGADLQSLIHDKNHQDRHYHHHHHHQEQEQEQPEPKSLGLETEQRQNNNNNNNDNNNDNNTIDIKREIIIKHECMFGRCLARVWFPGFKTAQDLWTHQQLHRCQWLVFHSDSVYRPCQYLPRNEDDFVKHLEYHLANDKIPTSRSFETNRIIYFCPWQTCSSLPYANKGASNKAHIVDHIRKHSQ